MTIADLTRPGKEAIGYLQGGESPIPGHVLIVLILVLSATASFALGYLAGQGGGISGKGNGFWVENLASSTALGGPASVEASTHGPAPADAASLTSGSYVASRSGKKYYLTTCTSAKRISDANKVYFKTKTDAEAKGYTPASNCPGL